MARPAGNNPAKSQITKIKMANKRINNTHRIVFANIIFKPLRKQSDLAAVFAFDKTRHLKIPKINITGFYHRSRFDTAWTQSGHDIRLLKNFISLGTLSSVASDQSRL
jgi:hypothetical protein